MITPVLESERIILRPAKLSDAEAIYSNWASDPEVAKYMRWNTHSSIEETKTWLTGVEASVADDNYDWLFVLKETNEPFGSGGIFYNSTHDKFEIGYCLMKQRWGQGFAYEAAFVILDFAINVLGKKEFFACCAFENLASAKILEKLGFMYKNDGEYSSFDCSRTFKSREYFLTV